MAGEIAGGWFDQSVVFSGVSRQFGELRHGTFCCNRHGSAPQESLLLGVSATRRCAYPPIYTYKS